MRKKAAAFSRRSSEVELLEASLAEREAANPEWDADARAIACQAAFERGIAPDILSRIYGHHLASKVVDQSVRLAAPLPKPRPSPPTVVERTLEIWPFSESWPIGEIGALLRRSAGNVDGICIGLTLGPAAGRTSPLVTTKMYHVGRNWWVLDSPPLGPLAESRSLFEKLNAARVLVCRTLKVPTNRIVWLPASSPSTAAKFGFRELGRSELAFAPPPILKLAAHSHSNPVGRPSDPLRTPHTGLYCLNETQLPKLTEMGAQLTADEARLKERLSVVLAGYRLLP